MPTQKHKRLPISCENCRRRKIKCPDNRPPCNACVRRGVPSTCRYVRETIETLSVAQANQHTVENLLKKIETLENLLERNIEVTAAAASNSPQTFSYSDQPSTRCDQRTEYHPAGTLISYPSGHVRYVPYSTAPDSTILQDFLEGTNSTLPPISDLPLFIDSAPSSRQHLLELLPPLSQCDQLLGVYMDVFSPLFHVLHDPTFHSEYGELKQNPQQVKLSFLSLVLVMLAMAVTALDEDSSLLRDLGREGSSGANIRSISARYRSAAMKCLASDRIMWRHDLRSVQSLVLLIYAINHVQGHAWPLLGTALHIAISIGCHIEPSHLNVDTVAAEERRRCWAALRMLYTIQSTCLGLVAPFTITTQVQLPADLDDDSIKNLDRTTSTSTPISPTEAPPTKMTYILYKFRLYNLAFEICQLSSNVTVPDPPLIMRLDEHIAQEESDHSRRFATWELPPHHLAHSYILRNYTSQLYLLLHRKFLDTDPGNGTSSENRQSAQVSRSRCQRSALCILENFEIFNTHHQLRPYRWYLYGVGCFQAFLAATTLLVLLAHSLVDADAIGSALHALDACSVHLSKISDRSEIAARAAAILRPLLEDKTFATAREAFQTVIADKDGGNRGAFHGGYPQKQVDLDGWNIPRELQDIIFELPDQQWLTPSDFPWPL